MHDLQQLAVFFGWFSAINIAFLTVASVILMLLKDSVSAMHGKMFGVPDAEIKLMYFKYLAYYKILIFVFALSPYIALRVML